MTRGGLKKEVEGGGFGQGGNRQKGGRIFRSDRSKDAGGRGKKLRARNVKTVLYPCGDKQRLGEGG